MTSVGDILWHDAILAKCNIYNMIIGGQVRFDHDPNNLKVGFSRRSR